MASSKIMKKVTKEEREYYRQGLVKGDYELSESVFWNIHNRLLKEKKAKRKLKSYK